MDRPEKQFTSLINTYICSFENLLLLECLKTSEQVLFLLLLVLEKVCKWKFDLESASYASLNPKLRQVKENYQAWIDNLLGKISKVLK